MLNSPYGIFVDVNFDLYIADNKNNRIQLFKSGHLNGTTVAGDNTISSELWEPSDIVLDADGYLFIADSGNNRIIRLLLVLTGMEIYLSPIGKTVEFKSFL
jgi:glucose/arabinose dehydrogenase